MRAEQKQEQEQAASVWLTCGELSKLACVAGRVMRRTIRRAFQHRTKWRGVTVVVRKQVGRGGQEGRRHEVLLSSLPAALQAKWHQQHAGAKLGGQAEAIAALPGGEGSDPEESGRPWTQARRETEHAAYATRPTSVQAEAKRRLRSVQLFHSFDGLDTPILQRYAAAAQDAGESVSTIRRWVSKCSGHHPGDWLVVLAPRYRGGQVSAEITPEAHEYVKREFFKQSQPALRPIYRRAKRLAGEKGWSLPSYATVKRIVKSEPHWYHVLMREGREALAQLYPAQERDFSTLNLHTIWCSDGRKADVFVRWEDGKIERPIVVAWIDLRSRVCLGYAIGRSESADLIRLAFKDAAEKSRALPDAVLLDSGRGFASKLLTGGAPNRFRFKVREEDVPGILTLLGVRIHWAMPYNARAKPIEPWWRNLAEMDKRFDAAYCGNKPDAKPEDFDLKKAAPIEQFRKILVETLSEYHTRPHRGDAMDGRSPLAIYEELLKQTIVREPTREQLRLCLLAAESVRLNSDDSSVIINGNRYWAEKLATLPRDVDYVVRFNPENATEPVSVYQGDRFICEAPLIARTGFRDQQAAKTYARAKRNFVKSRVEQAGLVKDMNAAAAWMKKSGEEGEPDPIGAAAAVLLPVPKVVRPLRPERDYRPQSAEADQPISKEEKEAAFRAITMSTRRVNRR